MANDASGPARPPERREGLAEAEPLLSTLADSTSDLIWAVDAERLGLLYFNRGLREYLRGQRGREVRVGMVPEEVLPTREEAERWYGFYRRALREGPFSVEYETVAAGLVLQLNLTPLARDGRAFAIAVFGRNVTEARRATDRLRQSEAFFRAVQQASADVASVIGRDGKYRFVSAASQGVLGYDIATVLASAPLAAIHPDDVPRAGRALERVRSGGPAERVRYRVRHRDGTWRHLEAVVRNELDNPDVQGILVNTRDVTEQVRLAARLELVREEEKGRIARDLHDQLGQLLTGLKLDLAWLEEKLEQLEPGPAVNVLLDRAVEASSLCDQTVGEVQRIATNLRPAALDRLGLVPALQQEARAFEGRSGVGCRVEAAATLPAIPAPATTALYRIAQEALTNVARHARATQVVVRLAAGPSEVILSVEDDGAGFEPAATGERHALGLAGMRERAALVGGELTVVRRAGGGTAVTAHVPTRADQEPP